MNKELKDLVTYLKNTNNPSFGKIFKLAQEVSIIKGDKIEESKDEQGIYLNVDDLISLVKPDAKIKRQELGFVAVNK